MSAFAPVALFGYDRSDHLKKTVEHLRANELASSTDVYLFADGAKNSQAVPGVQAVRAYAHEISGFKSVTLIEREKNWGLLRSMIDGVGQIAKEHGKVIVLEDDIITNPKFLVYMNSALDFYNDYKTVGQISGYVAPYVAEKSKLGSQDTFFHYRSNCWGWATWWDRWGKADWDPENWHCYFQSAKMKKLFGRSGDDFLQMFRDSMEGRNQSWMARWYYNCFLHGMLTLYPGRSLVDNIGFDGSGTHSRKAKASVYQKYRTPVELLVHGTFNFSLPIYIDDTIHKAMKHFWDPPWRFNNPLYRAIRPIYRFLRNSFTNKKP